MSVPPLTKAFVTVPHGVLESCEHRGPCCTEISVLGVSVAHKAKKGADVCIPRLAPSEQGPREYNRMLLRLVYSTFLLFNKKSSIWFYHVFSDRLVSVSWSHK